VAEILWQYRDLSVLHEDDQRVFLMSDGVDSLCCWQVPLALLIPLLLALCKDPGIVLELTPVSAKEKKKLVALLVHVI